MALTEAEIESLVFNGKPGGSKHADGQALYLHVFEAGKYWRMDYRFNGKQKTLAFGVYPAVSIADARLQRDKVRKLLANGIDPGEAKKEASRTKLSMVETCKPTHPGAVLREEVIPKLPISRVRMAQLLGVSTVKLARLLQEEQSVSCDMALRLESVLGTSAESWMNMQLAVDLWNARQELDRIVRIGQLAIPGEGKTATK